MLLQTQKCTLLKNVYKDLFVTESLKKKKKKDKNLSVMSAKKIARWIADKGDDSVALLSGVDLTVHPSSSRASFPGLSPLTMLTPQQLADKFLKVPSTTMTGVVSFAIGALWMAALVRIKPASSFLRRAWLRLVSLLLMFALQYFLRRRRPQLPSTVSQMDNVSSSPKGPCRVICNAVLLTNSHAGTHADTPYHFAKDRVPTYPDVHYTGRSVLVDLTEYLKESRGITKKILQQFESDHQVSLLSCWRLLFRTTLTTYASSDVWQSNNAYFELDASEYLSQSETLMLVGLDTPSVDGACVSPIGDATHGIFLKAGIAILENLSFDAIPFRGDAVVQGSMLTVFNPALAFEDSRGCMVTFFPKA